MAGGRYSRTRTSTAARVRKLSSPVLSLVRRRTTALPLGPPTSVAELTVTACGVFQLSSVNSRTAGEKPILPRRS